MRRITLPIIAAALSLTLPSSAINLCGVSDVFDLSNIDILPFGGEIIGVSVAVGEIVNTNVDIRFTATGTFNAADIGVAFEIFDAGGGVGVGFTGAQLGWSGQGTFTHQFDTSALNGLLYPSGEFSTIIVSMSNLNPGNGPITGNFDRMVYRIDFGRCPLGDVNHDLNVNVADLLAVISSWGACPTPPASCPADFNGSGAVDVSDLLTVIANWGTFCPKCS